MNKVLIVQHMVNGLQEGKTSDPNVEKDLSILKLYENDSIDHLLYDLHRQLTHTPTHHQNRSKTQKNS